MIQSLVSLIFLSEIDSMVCHFFVVRDWLIRPERSQLWAAILSVVLVIAFGADSANAEDRTEWTSGRITGSPEPPAAFRQVRRFPNLQFVQPLAIEKDPANQRLWVVTRKAQIYSFPDQDDVKSADLFVDLQAEFSNLIPLEKSTRVGSAFCIAFHPNYPEVPYCWITYTLKIGHWKEHAEQGSRLSRFRVLFEDGVPKCDVGSERVLLSWLEGGHNGGAIRFGPDGYLYVSAGDGEVPNPPDPRRAGQDVTNQLSTIFRIDVSTSDEGPAYQIPTDNPFAKLVVTADTAISKTVQPDVAAVTIGAVTDKTVTHRGQTVKSNFTAEEAMPEIWAYGFRNPWKMNFDHQGRLWVGDVGWELNEMIQNVARGGNYGWSLFEGTQPLLSAGKRGPTAVLPSALVYDHSEGASVTGGLVYRGRKFPELQNQYIFGDYETRRIWASKIIDAEVPSDSKLEGLSDLVEPTLRIVAFGEDSDNELLLIHMDEGTLYGLEHNETSESDSEFPTRLSDTGLFEDVGLQKPMAGVVPFEIIEPLFSDNTFARRWIALSGAAPGQVLKAGKRRDNSPLRDHIIVETDSVAVRTVQKQDDSGEIVNLETQILHFNGKVWKPYSYVWNVEQTDATLVPDAGATVALDSIGKFAKSETYRVHSRSECIRCHNSWVGGLLAFSLPQLNRSVLKPSSSGLVSTAGPIYDSVNQLEQFRESGLLAGAIPEFPTGTEEQHCKPLANSRGGDADLEHKVRSYLDVNCAHCHQQGAGGTATIDLRYQATLDDAKLIGAVPMQGTFGLTKARIVTAGAAERSVLLYRMACDGRGHMPHIGSDQVDGRAVKLVAEWIGSMRPDDALLPTDSPPMNSSLLDLLATTTGALQIMQSMDKGKLDDVEMGTVLTAARSAAPEIRNLFVRFQPLQYQTKRRVLDERAILSLEGNPDAGEAVFRSVGLQCATCHQVAGQGGEVGPSLDKPDISKQNSGQLLDSILYPSRKVAEKFRGWTLIATNGKVTTGLLKERTETSVTLVDAKAESFTFIASEIDELIKQDVSMMPDRLVESLTDQQIADLIAWIQSR